MARRLSWSDVRGGLVATVVVVVVVVATLRYSRVGSLHGATMTLYAHVGEASGLLVGSEVWLSGQKIGRVADIRFRSPFAADTSARIEIVMQVLSEYRTDMREDALAQIRAGGTVIGQPVVYVSPGTVAAPPIRDGDTISTRSQPDMEGASGQFGLATRELPGIVKNVKEIVTQLQSSQGTVGAALNAPGGPGGAELGHIRTQANQIAARLADHGTSVYTARGSVSDRARQVMARADSVRTLLASNDVSYGRIRKDSTLTRTVSDIQQQLSTVRSQLTEPRGTVGRYRGDSTLTVAIAQAQREMSLLLVDLKKHPLRYISF